MGVLLKDVFISCPHEHYSFKTLLNLYSNLSIGSLLLCSTCLGRKVIERSHACSLSVFDHEATGPSASCIKIRIQFELQTINDESSGTVAVMHIKDHVIFL